VSRSGGFLMLLLMALGVFAAVYLLFGDSMTSGYGGRGYEEGGGERAADGGLLDDAGLEATGKKPKSPEEIAAEIAAREAEKNRVRPEEGVFGTVSDGQGNPVAGASVKLFADPPERRSLKGVPDGTPVATAVTEQDGTFVVGPSPADGHARIRAEAAGYAPSMARVRQRGACVDLILDLGGQLEVRTIDREGKPIADAQVIHTAGTVVTAQLTDAEGFARFQALPTGTGGLVVVREGYGIVRDANLAVAPGEKEERTIVMPRGLELVGTVLDAQTERPVEGAQIAVRYTQLPMLEETAGVQTDEEGRFKLMTWAGGNEQMMVRVRKEGYAEARPWRNAQHKGELTVKLQKEGEAVSGRVVGADRQPVGGVRVSYVGQQAEEKGTVPEAISDDDGNFTLALPAWSNPGARWTVVGISDEHGVGVAYVRVPKKDQAPAKAIELSLGGTGTVKGTVKDGGGAPVQGAVVSLAPDWAAAQRRPGRNRIPWQLVNLLNAGVHHNLTALTGVDGKYEITDVPALEYKVTATYGLDNFTLPEAVQVEDSEAAEADISLGEGGTIEGVVLDSDDKPVPGAYVSAKPQQRSNNYGWWQSRPTARSQSDGKFVLRGIADQRYDMWAYAAGYGNVQEKNVSRGHKDIVMRLKARGWIVGVLRRDGSPYGGTFTVVVRPVKANSGINRMGNFNGMWVPGQQQRTFNTDDGRFEIKGLNAGDYTVQATTPEGMLAVQPDVVTVMDGRPSREARLELTEGAVVKGIVRDDETGKALSNIWVYAMGKTPEGGSGAPPQGHGQTDSKGHYEIKGLGTATYTISAYVGGAPVQQVVELRTGETRQLNLAKLPPGSIQFVVVDEEGNPMPGAYTQIRTATGNWVGVNIQAMRKEGLIGSAYNWSALTRTGADGSLMRYHIPPGILTVWATKSGYTKVGPNQEIEVASGSVTQVEIKLKKRK